MDKTVFHFKTRKLEAIQCFSTQDTNGQNSVSLRQGNLKQFNVSVLRIPMDKTVFHYSVLQLVSRHVIENSVYHTELRRVVDLHQIVAGKVIICFEKL